MHFITAFSFILVVVLVPLAAVGVGWLGARVGALIQTKVTSARLRTALLRLDDAVVTAVKDLMQTLAAELRERAADGQLSGEDRRHLKETAIRRVKTFLGGPGIKELQEVLGVWELGAEDYIASKVEASVHDLKLARAPRTTTTSTPEEVSS